MSEITANDKNFKHPKPEFFVANELMASDGSCMIRITGRAGKDVAYSWELVRPKKIGKAETARFFQVYTSTVLGVVRITNPMSRLIVSDLIADAENWILDQMQEHEDQRQQQRIDREQAQQASRGRVNQPAGLKTTLAKQDRARKLGGLGQ